MTSTNIEETNMAHNNTPDYLVQYLHSEIKDNLKTTEFENLKSISNKDIATDFDFFSFGNDKIWVWLDRSISEINRNAVIETFKTCEKQFGRYPLTFNNNKLKIHTIVIAAYSEVAHSKSLLPMATIGNTLSDFQLMVGYDKPYNQWGWRHETVHLMDNAYQISSKEQASSILPVDNLELENEAEQFLQKNDYAGFVSNSWKHTLDSIDQYTKTNPPEQFVVDVLAVQFNKPKEIIKNLAHGCYHTFGLNAKGNGKLVPQTKKYYKQLAQKLLPSVDDDLYRDVRLNLKAGCDWIL